MIKSYAMPTKMRKKLQSKRNRHNGHINSFKQMCIEKGERFIYNEKMYAWFQHPPKLGMTKLPGRTLVRMS